MTPSELARVLHNNVRVSTPEERFSQLDQTQTRNDLTQGYVRYPEIQKQLRRIAYQSRN